jgi:hypothetical protein
MSSINFNLPLDFRKLTTGSILIGTIEKMYYGSDTADVKIRMKETVYQQDNFVTFMSVPVFYHCQKRATVVGGSKAFQKGDIVLVLNQKDDNTAPSNSDLTIIGFQLGPKLCFFEGFVCHPRSDWYPNGRDPDGHVLPNGPFDYPAIDNDHGTTGINLFGGIWEVELNPTENYGNIDWQAILTWKGPTDRVGLDYDPFRAISGLTRIEEFSSGSRKYYQSPFWPFIYKSGEILAMVPKIPEGSNTDPVNVYINDKTYDVSEYQQVLGASLIESGNGHYLFCITTNYRDGKGKVYVSTGNPMGDLYDEKANLTGWRQIFEFIEGRAIHPWFFSEDGLHAVSVRYDKVRTIAINLQGMSASLSESSAIQEPEELFGTKTTITTEINTWPGEKAPTHLDMYAECRKFDDCYAEKVEPYQGTEKGDQHDTTVIYGQKGRRITTADYKGNSLVYAYERQSGTGETKNKIRRATIYGDVAETYFEPTSHEPKSAQIVGYSDYSVWEGATLGLDTVNICVQNVEWSFICPGGAQATITKLDNLIGHASAMRIDSFPSNCCAHSGEAAVGEAIAVITERFMDGSTSKRTVKKKYNVPGGSWVADTSKPPSSILEEWRGITYYNGYYGTCTDTDGGYSCANKVMASLSENPEYRYVLYNKVWTDGGTLTHDQESYLDKWTPNINGGLGYHLANCSYNAWLYYETTNYPAPNWELASDGTYTLPVSMEEFTTGGWLEAKELGKVYIVTVLYYKILRCAYVNGCPNLAGTYTYTSLRYTPYAHWSGWQYTSCTQKWVCP